jgi:hypothetical protein
LLLFLFWVGFWEDQKRNCGVAGFGPISSVDARERALIRGFTAETACRIIPRAIRAIYANPANRRAGP